MKHSCSYRVTTYRHYKERTEVIHLEDYGKLRIFARPYRPFGYQFTVPSP